MKHHHALRWEANRVSEATLTISSRSPFWVFPKFKPTVVRSRQERITSSPRQFVIETGGPLKFQRGISFVYVSSKPSYTGKDLPCQALRFNKKWLHGLCSVKMGDQMTRIEGGFNQWKLKALVRNLSVLLFACTLSLSTCLLLLLMGSPLSRRRSPWKQAKHGGFGS